MTLVPAYGRDYKSKQACLAAWNDGFDFQIASIGLYQGSYCSKLDKAELGKLTIRYNKLRRALVI
jgi:hypothetical protein